MKLKNRMRGAGGRRGGDRKIREKKRKKMGE